MATSYFTNEEKKIVKEILTGEKDTQVLKFVQDAKVHTARQERYDEYKASETLEDFTNSGGKLSDLFSDLKLENLTICTDEFTNDPSKVTINVTLKQAKDRANTLAAEKKAAKEAEAVRKAEEKVALKKDKEMAVAAIKEAKKLLKEVAKKNSKVSRAELLIYVQLLEQRLYAHGVNDTMTIREEAKETCEAKKAEREAKKAEREAKKAAKEEAGDDDASEGEETAVVTETEEEEVETTAETESDKVDKMSAVHEDADDDDQEMPDQNEENTESESDWEKTVKDMNVNELKAACKDKGLRSGGIKSVLQDRLINA